MKKVIRINEQGFFVEDVILNGSEKIPKDCTDVECREGFYFPRFDGKKWIEGLTETEIVALKKDSSKLTETDKLWQTIEYLIASDYNTER